jgi:hypothetical protein
MDIPKVRVFLTRDENHNNISLLRFEVFMVEDLDHYLLVYDTM